MINVLRSLIGIFIILINLTLLEAQPIPTGPTSKYFYLNSQESSYATGVFVHLNDTIRIIARGSFYNGDGIVPTPDGFGGTCNPQYGLTTLPNIACNALIGAIGNSSQNFKTLLDGGGSGIYGSGFVGCDFKGIATDSGEIYLGINDVPLSDNAGWIEVSILINSLEITRPKEGDRWIAGTKDTIQWENGVENLYLKFKYSIDDGDNYELIDAGIKSGDNMYIWEIPEDLLTVKARIKIEHNDNSDLLAKSEKFKIKPYLITRLDPNGDYVGYDNIKDSWGFGNYEWDMWPESWYQRFDYQSGIDPFTGTQYDQTINGGVFSTARRSDFTDWESFVNAFGINACYIDVASADYSFSAVEKWAAKKRDWGGSCWAMAGSNALVFERKSGFLSKYNNFPFFIEPNAVNSDNNVIKTITELYAQVYGNPTQLHYRITTEITPNQTLNQLKELLMADQTDIRSLTFWNNNGGGGGHCILPYQVGQDDDEDNIWYVWVYDNSEPYDYFAVIVINTEDNNGNGSWHYNNLPDWGGNKDFILELPALTYLGTPTLPKTSVHKSPFILNNEALDIYAADVDIIITDQAGNKTGYYNDTLFAEIPGSRPITIPTGRETKPDNYFLMRDNYSVVLENFDADTTDCFLFTGNKSYRYERTSAANNQTDKLFFDGGFSFTNPDSISKLIKLVNIIVDTTNVDEKSFVLGSISMIQNDSIKILNPDDNKLDLISYGSAKDYDIELAHVSEIGMMKFLHKQITLNQNSTHRLYPNWGDFEQLQLTIYVDEGNDGTVDDTLYLENELTGIGEDQGSLIPTEFRLEQNYPNPFNSSTKIKFTIPDVTLSGVEGSLVTLKVYDILGNEVAILVDEYKPAGTYEVEFQSAVGSRQLASRLGSALTSGVYFYQLHVSYLQGKDGQAGDFISTKKMLLIK